MQEAIFSSLRLISNFEDDTLHFIWNLEGKQIHVFVIPQLYEGKIVYVFTDEPNRNTDKDCKKQNSLRRVIY